MKILMWLKNLMSSKISTTKGGEVWEVVLKETDKTKDAQIAYVLSGKLIRAFFPNNNEPDYNKKGFLGYVVIEHDDKSIGYCGFTEKQIKRRIKKIKEVDSRDIYKKEADPEYSYAKHPYRSRG